MYLFSNEIYDKIHNQFILNLLIGKKYLLHGTFASKKSKYMTDVDVTNYYRMTDTATCKNNIHKKISSVISSLPSNCYFNNLLAGFDERFLIEGTLNKDGKIKGFTTKSLKKRLDTLLKKEVIDKDEHNELTSFIKEEPNTTEYYILLENLLKYAQLSWTKEEIIKGEKTYRKKKFKLIDMITAKFGKYIQNNPFVFQYIVRYDDMKYVGLDVALIFYRSKSGQYNSNNIEIVRDDHFKANVELINFIFGTDDLWIYIGIFKNLAQEKYLKAFKRLRTLLTSIMFNKSTNSKNRSTLYKIRKDMLDELNETDFNKYNQIKNRIEVIYFLFENGLVKKEEIYGLILKVIEDLWNCTEYNSDKTKLKDLFDKIKSDKLTIEKLENIKRGINEKINSGAKKLFEQYYTMSKTFLPFTL
jgi:hypothetical protein